MPRDERKTLVAELFGLIEGRVKDFVFKHDSVRTVQTALKYATPDQRKSIAKELQGEYRTLVEGRYSKFLVAKLLVQGDKETREMVISEFYGHVKKLINHPEASWILDDTYRQLASPAQKTRLLREWYGPEYSMLQTTSITGNDNTMTADLPTILKTHPETKRPTLKHLHTSINSLIQKKMTAFTMLHDAMLQYSLSISATEDISDWLTLLTPSDEADLDLLKNLAFTPSGVRVVTRALALGTAKDRRSMLRAFKDHIETITCDSNAVHVLLAAYEVVDDTKMLSKLIFPELLAAKTVDHAERTAAIAAMATHPTGRVALLWLIVSEGLPKPKWLVQPTSQTDTVLAEVNAIKSTAGTSKKQDPTRRAELLQALLTTSESGILATINQRTNELSTSSFGCQFVAEVLLHAGDGSSSDDDDAAAAAAVRPALGSVARLATATQSPTPAIGRLLKSLAQGGPYDSDKKTAIHVPWLTDFPHMLWEHIAPRVAEWATGPESFVVVALAENGSFSRRAEVLGALQKVKGELEGAKGQGDKGAAVLLELV